MKLRKNKAESKKVDGAREPFVVSLESLAVEEGFNPRSKKRAQPDELFIESIKAYGIETPIRVRELEHEKDKLFIVDGHRRFAAAQKLELKKVPVVNLGPVGDVEAITDSWRRNTLQDTYNKKEKLDVISALNKKGLGVTEISIQLTLSKSTVSEYLKLSKADPALRKAVGKSTKEGGIATQVALQAAKLPKEEQKKAASELKGKTRAEAKESLPRRVVPKISTPPKAKADTPTPAPESPKNGYFATDYEERCRKMEAEVTKKLTAQPSNKKWQGMGLAIAVLRGKMTVEQAFQDWDVA